MQSITGSSRRNLLCACVGGAIGGACLSSPGKSRVAIARNPAAPPDATHLAALVDRAVAAACNRDAPVEAWKSIVRPGETVGLKVNCLSGKGGSTSIALVEAVCERLQQAGIPPRSIVIWDRLTSDLEEAGHRTGARKDRIRCLGNDEAGYESELAVFGSVGSLLSNTLTRTCDAVINLPVLKDHGIVGVTMALKNLFGAIHNPNKYHLNGGDPYVADVYMLPPIRQKVRLTICDALAPQYEGGPSYMPQWVWPYRGVLASRDPVALDATGWRIIERKRAELGLKPLGEMKREPLYIARAADARHRIGASDPASIEVLEV